MLVLGDAKEGEQVPEVYLAGIALKAAVTGCGCASVRGFADLLPPSKPCGAC